MHWFTRPSIVAVLVSALMVLISADTQAQVRLSTIWEDEAREQHHWLGLTGDELDIAQSIQRTYHERAEAELFPLLREASTAMRQAASASNNPAGWNYDSYGLFVKAYQLQNRAFQALMQVDESYFQDLAVLVRDEKKIERLRWRRMRLIYRRDRGEQPGGNVDLFRFLDDLERRLEPETLLHVNEWRSRWEPMFIEFLRRSVEENKEGNYLFAKFADADARLKNNRFETHPAGHWERIVHDFHQRVGYAPILSRKLELVAFVEARLAELREVLDPPSAYEVETRFLEESFPEAYPDPASAEQLYIIAFALEDLTEEQREALGIVRWEFRIEHDRLSREICDALRTARREALQPPPGSTHWGMDEAGAKREQLNLEQVERLRRILLPEQFRHLPEWDFKKNPPLRPWNFRDNDERYRAMNEVVSGPDTPRPSAPGFHE